MLELSIERFFDSLDAVGKDTRVGVRFAVGVGSVLGFTDSEINS